MGRRCRYDGCNKYSQRRGLCTQHGGAIPSCTVDGCAKKIVQGGVCMEHGAQVPKCSIANCTRNAKNHGLCVRHGAVTKKCNFEGCTKQTQQGGRCLKHGGKVKLCEVKGCTKYAQKDRKCISHGSRSQNSSIAMKAMEDDDVVIRRCKKQHCNKAAKKDGLCLMHKISERNSKESSDLSPSTTSISSTVIDDAVPSTLPNKTSYYTTLLEEEPDIGRYYQTSGQHGNAPNYGVPTAAGSEYPAYGPIQIQDQHYALIGATQQFEPNYQVTSQQQSSPNHFNFVNNVGMMVSHSANGAEAFFFSSSIQPPDSSTGWTNGSTTLDPSPNGFSLNASNIQTTYYFDVGDDQPSTSAPLL